jgi:hypothetical protein
MSKALRIECHKCKTVFVAAELPIDVMTLAKKVLQSSCPNCFESASKSNIYTGGDYGKKEGR